MDVIEIPNRLPLLVVADGVVFPSTYARVPVRSAFNVAAINNCLHDQSQLVRQTLVIAYRCTEQNGDNSVVLDNARMTVNSIGTAVYLTHVIGTSHPRESYTLKVIGLCRVKIVSVKRLNCYYVNVHQLDRMLDTPVFKLSAINAFIDDVTRLAQTMSSHDIAARRFLDLRRTVPSAMIVDIACALLHNLSYERKLTLLNTVDIASRMSIAHKHIKEALGMNEEEKRFSVEVIDHDKDTLAHVISQVFGARPINVGRTGGRWLDTAGQSQDDDAKLLHKLRSVGMPDQVAKQVMRDYEKYSNASPMSAEKAPLRNYLELVSELPWKIETTDTLDMKKAGSHLEADHYGLADVKKRVLEYLAVRKIRNTIRGPILCFVGPPGVGKTSIVKSIAATLSRRYAKISVGGISDQSDIRGHRRTYVGAMPGRIIDAIKNAKSRNPVCLLDEVDKMYVGNHGDPSAALLEVLDPEQNCSFVDHYLNVPFDLSKVLFVATANSMKTIPAPLLDRMEIINIPGYTIDEKLHIASRHLLPKQLNEHGLDTSKLQIAEGAILSIVDKYTKEAGVRMLERKLAAVCRWAALTIANAFDSKLEDSVKAKADCELPIIVTDIDLTDVLGQTEYYHDEREYILPVGVACGLAWSPVGGELLYIETSRDPNGTGKLTTTGSLGDVMRESTRLALVWLTSKAHNYGLDAKLFKSSDIHIHFPAGAISKDGPSAGVSILIALMSLFSNRRVRSDTAATGEITLRGVVLPVGGIKAKVLAAHRAAIKRIILPKRNEIDVESLDDSIKKSLQFCYVTTMDAIFRHAFDDYNLPLTGGDNNLDQIDDSKL